MTDMLKLCMLYPIILGVKQIVSKGLKTIQKNPVKMVYKFLVIYVILHLFLLVTLLTTSVLRSILNCHISGMLVDGVL